MSYSQALSQRRDVTVQCNRCTGETLGTNVRRRPFGGFLKRKMPNEQVRRKATACRRNYARP